MELIRRGHRHRAVADFQARLEHLGFVIEPSELGGTFGPSTETTIKEFQQRWGLDVDGIVGEATWRALVESSWTLGDRPLRLSEPFLRGDDVRELQASLNALGFTAGKHDGIFGFGTASALRDFQRNLSIDEDGIAGLETIRALARLRMVIKPGLGPRITEREARRAGGRSWLFFGERNFRSDFLYQAEWQTYLKEGVLTRMDVAFSRDRAGKVYVQDRMRDRAADLFAWLEE
ncbi:MAG: peptidoglycan-binding protein, partial [Actinobacteria bacterium]|nr:peptidoglycan-binding protein [Actinomycetota bacterium]